MISNYALEDCCGVMYQWTDDVYESTPSSTWTSGEQYMNGYTWNSASVYKGGTDSIDCGASCGILRRLVVGGSYNAGTYSGSRCVRGDLLSGYPHVMVGARGVSLPKIA
jgi:hypothetical protein